MTDWIEEARAQTYRENLAALRKEYDRRLAEGQFPDTQDSWSAFVYGWQGTRYFEQAKRVLNTSDSGYFSVTSLCWLVGGFTLAAVVIGCFIIPPERLVLTNVGWFAGASLALIGLGFLTLRRGRRLAAITLAKHRAKWGNPEDEREKLVDDSEESSYSQ